MIRHAFRRVARSPLNSIALVVTLSLGFTALASAASFASRAWIKDLPFSRGDLVTVWETRNGESNRIPTSIPLYRAVAELGSIAAAGVSVPFGAANVTSDDGSFRVSASVVSASYLELLDATPVVGTLFRDDDPGPVVLVSEALWRGQFGAEPGLVGSAITLNGQPYTVAGVVSDAFGDALGPGQPGVWVPISEGMPFLSPRFPDDPTFRRGVILAHLREGVGLEVFDQQLDALMDGLIAQAPESFEGFGIAAYPLREFLLNRLRQPILILVVASVALWLVSLLNGVALVINRFTRRIHEVAVRMAIGGSRRSAILEHLVEIAVLVVLAVGPALLTTRYLTRFLGDGTSRFLSSFLLIELDAPTLLITAAAAFVAVLACGTAPALLISGPSFLRLLSSRVTGGTRRLQRVGPAIVSTQVAVTVVLAVGAGLIGRSMLKMVSADLGFVTEGVFSFRVDVPTDPYTTREEVFRLASDITTAITLRTGAAADIWTPRRPGEVSGGARMYPEDQPDLAPKDVLISKYHQVTPGALTRLGISIVKGRDFDQGDGPTSVPVAIVSNRLAERLWPGEDPIGKRVRHYTSIGEATDETPYHEVVGVAEDVLMGGLIELGGIRPDMDIYYPLAQRYRRIREFVVLVHPPALTATESRDLIAELDPRLPVYSPASLTEVLANERVLQKTLLQFIGVFGVIALLLTGLGIYGVVAEMVGQRRWEVALRMALGSSPGGTVGLFGRRVIAFVGAGVVAGIILSLGLSDLIASQLYGVTSTDPVAPLVAVVVIGLASTLAVIGPIRSAIRTDPASELRSR